MVVCFLSIPKQCNERCIQQVLEPGKVKRILCNQLSDRLRLVKNYRIMPPEQAGLSADCIAI